MLQKQPDALFSSIHSNGSKLVIGLALSSYMICTQELRHNIPPLMSLIVLEILRVRV